MLKSFLSFLLLWVLGFSLLWMCGTGTASALSITTAVTAHQSVTHCKFDIDGAILNIPVTTNADGDRCIYTSGQDVVGQHRVSIRYCSIGETTNCSPATDTIAFSCLRQVRGPARITCSATGAIKTPGIVVN